MKILVTGGCGFIGTNLVGELLRKGSFSLLRIVDNLSVGTRSALEETLARESRFSTVEEEDKITFEMGSIGSASGDEKKTSCELLVGDIRDKEHAVKACRGIDTVVHLAANTGVFPSVENPRLDFESNVLGTLNYLEACRINGVKRFVFASSGAPVGECRPPIHEEIAPHPVSPYGASKLAGEGYCSAYFRTFGVETVALRFSNVYGPGSGHKSSVVAKFIGHCLRGEELEIYGSGNQTRDFIFINDLVRAICLAMTVDDIGGETFQIATNTETTIAELTNKLSAVFKAAGFEDIPVRHSEFRKGDVMRNFSDTSKADKILGWRTETDLESGLSRTFDWFLHRSKQR